MDWDSDGISYRGRVKWRGMWYPAKISHGPGMLKRISAARQQAHGSIETGCNLQSLTETVVLYFGYGDVFVSAHPQDLEFKTKTNRC